VHVIDEKYIEDIKRNFYILFADSFFDGIYGWQDENVMIKKIYVP
jgi:hypothetical protein